MHTPFQSVHNIGKVLQKSCQVLIGLKRAYMTCQRLGAHLQCLEDMSTVQNSFELYYHTFEMLSNFNYILKVPWPPLSTKTFTSEKTTPNLCCLGKHKYRHTFLIGKLHLLLGVKYKQIRHTFMQSNVKDFHGEPATGINRKTVWEFQQITRNANKKVFLFAQKNGKKL